MMNRVSDTSSFRWNICGVRRIASFVFLVASCSLVDFSNKAYSAEQVATCDVCIYGATPCGIAAALAAGRDGKQVLLVEPTAQIGGLVTSGLSHTDFHSFESLSGAYWEFAQRVEGYYSKTYGDGSPQQRDSFRGTFAEPKVNLLVFNELLREVSTVRLKLKTSVIKISTSKTGAKMRIDEAVFSTQVTDDAVELLIRAQVYIDASYEGDLMALATSDYRVGREGREEFDETLAPEKADTELQAYNFRFCMTQDPKNIVVPTQPAGYRREDFIGVLESLASGRIRTIFGYPDNCIFKAQTPPLPNGKYDINDVSRSLVRLSLPGFNLAWPEGSSSDRDRVYRGHLYDQVGLLYFLQNDESVPKAFRDEARRWGFCRDEFTESQHLPPQLYVREARRLQGVKIFTQRDSDYAMNGRERDARAVLHSDSIAMGDYGNNCHGTAHEGPRFGGKHTGDFYNPTPPYQIPYGVLLPKSITNLLVPGAVSSTHVGFCALRLEPIWMSLGQAAGHAATFAIDAKSDLQSVPVSALQSRLHDVGSATIYVSDVRPGHSDFAAVQWWGTLGGLHGLEPGPAKLGQRGESIHGQYYEATPGHAVKLHAVLDDATRERWSKLLPDGIPAPATATTRGEWIAQAYKAYRTGSR